MLSLIGSTLTLAGMFLFRRFMAERSIAYVVGFLTIVGTVLSLADSSACTTASRMDGAHDRRRRRCAVYRADRYRLESPLGQISMIPMLAWIANSAPAHLKATFFAVMASFTNLALSLASSARNISTRSMSSPGRSGIRQRRHPNAPPTTVSSATC